MSTIKDKVVNELEILKKMTQQELTSWAKCNGIGSRQAFGKFKKELLEQSIDYDGMRLARIKEDKKILEEEYTHEITLYSDANAKTRRFGICLKNGDPIWYGKFFDEDSDFNGEQSSAEMSSAKKAVWLASKVAEKLGVKLKLNLYIDAEWLTWANNLGKRGGKALQLRELARKLNVCLEVTHINGAENPADQYTRCHGFKSYRENNFEELGTKRRM